MAWTGPLTAMAPVDLTSTLEPPPSPKVRPKAVIGPPSLASTRLSARPEPSAPVPDVRAPVVTVVAPRMAMSSPAEAEAICTAPVRPRTATSRPACRAPVVAVVPSARMSWPAVTPTVVTVPPPDLAVWKRASVEALTAPESAIDPPSDFTSMSEPESVRLVFRVEGSATSRISPA